MRFEVDPRPVRGRSHGRASIVALGVLGVIALALMSAIASGAPDPHGSGNVTPGIVPPDGASLARGILGAPASTTLPGSGRLPAAAAIDCHDLSAASCAALSLAAVRELDAEGLGITAIDAWRSLLCGDDFDCPGHRLTGNHPLGSAIVTVDSGAQAWVNVVETGSGDRLGSEPDRTIAWVIRWVP